MNTKKLLMTIIGNMIIAFGVSVLNLSGFGLDAFTAMNLGVSSVLHVGLGIYQSVFNILLCIPIYLMFKKALGIGSLVNMFLFGYFVQFFMYLWGVFGITPALFEAIVIKAVLLFVGFMVTNFGASLYMACDNGVGPYDALGPLIEAKTNIPFRYARIITDFCCAAIGFIAGNIAGVTTIGVATIVVVLFTGPVISFYRSAFVDRWIEKLN